jgi:cytochrome c peroxidase
MKYPGPVLRWLALLSIFGCADDFEELSEDERAQLARFVLGPDSAPPVDESNRVAGDPAAARLGQRFFFDARFSGPLRNAPSEFSGTLGSPGESGRVACASCHDPASGGVDHRSPGPTSLGADWTSRHSPTVFNAALQTWQFWDGRRDSLWSQALSPIENPNEHNFSRLEVVRLIAQAYEGDYEAVFGPLPDLSSTTRFPLAGKPGVPAWDAMSAADKDLINKHFANFGKAIAAYEHQLLSRNSAFDRYMLGEEDALSPAAIRGARLFVGKAACDECHRGPNFSDDGFHNHGIPQVGQAVASHDLGRFAGMPEVKNDVFNRNGRYSDAPLASHLEALVVSDRLKGAFKTPTLREVASTGPYMHTGQLATLWDVLEWYNEAAAGGGFEGTPDPALRPLFLSNGEMNDLVEFLMSLSGEPIADEWRLPPAP